MSIDGIGGPKGPPGPQKPGSFQPSQPLRREERVDESFELNEAEPSPRVMAQEADVTITAAFNDVAQSFRTGRIQTLQAAFDAVITRVVESRYADMEPRQRQRFTAHLKEILADDPVIGERIRALLQNALESGPERSD